MADALDNFLESGKGDNIDAFLEGKPKKEGLYEGFVKPTAKAIPRVTGAMAGGFLAYPVSGLAGLSRLITTGSLDEANKTMQGIQEIPSKLLTTPEEQAGAENIGLVMKPFEWAREAGQYAGRKAGIPYAEPTLGTLSEAGAMFALPGSIVKGGRAIKRASDFRSVEGVLEPTETPTLRPPYMEPQPYYRPPVKGPEKPGRRSIPIRERIYSESEINDYLNSGLENQGEGIILTPEEQVAKGIKLDETLKTGRVEDQGQGTFKEVQRYPGEEIYFEEIKMPVIDKIDSFLDEKPTPPVADVAALKETPLETGKVSTEPEIVNPGTTSEGKSNLLSNEKLPGTTLTSGIDISKTPEVLKALSEKVGQTSGGRFLKGVGEELHSPEVILSREPAGKVIYQVADRADLAKNSFLAREGAEFEKSMKEGLLKPDSEASAKVGQALDGKIPRSALNAGEQKAYDFFKQKYHFLIQEAGKAAAGDAATYKTALNLANQKSKPIVKVSDLSKGEQTHYKGLKTPNERIDYLHDKWKQTQPENLVKSYDILSRELKDYLPRIFDKDTLLEGFKVEIADINNKMRTATDPGAITNYKERLRMLEDSVKTIEGGGFVKYSQLPRNLRFRFFETRKGKEGYSFDAVKAYQTYLTGISRKVFDEPAVKAMSSAYEDLSPDLKPYADWYIRRFSGARNKSKMEDFANAVASFQWMRTLGLNPRSALVNLSQRVNTIAEVGVKYSTKGEKFAFTDAGKKLFDDTGIAQEVPQVLYEGGAPKFEKARAIVGWMFNKMEVGNRRHAFLSAYLKGKESMGMTEAQAIQYGIDITHKSQFRYGRVGMPKVLTTPAGRMALQFWSFPIKQVEWLQGSMKADMAKARAGKMPDLVWLKYLALAEGGNLALQEWLNTDMSSAMGIGVNWSEALNAVKDLSHGDIREMFRHTRMVLNPGGGLLPSGPGPTLTGAIKVAQAAGEGKGIETLKKELTPVVYQRGKQTYEAIKGEQGGKYPIKNAQGYPSVKLTGGELIQRTIGPKTATEYKAQREMDQKISLQKERNQIVHEIVVAIADKDIEKARSLIKETGVMPTKLQVENEFKRRLLTRTERGHLKKPGKYEQFQYQKEGRIY